MFDQDPSQSPESTQISRHQSGPAQPPGPCGTHADLPEPQTNQGLSANSPTNMSDGAGAEPELARCNTQQPNSGPAQANSDLFQGNNIGRENDSSECDNEDLSSTEPNEDKLIGFTMENKEAYAESTIEDTERCESGDVETCGTEDPLIKGEAGDGSDEAVSREVSVYTQALKPSVEFSAVDHNPFLTIKQANHFRRQEALVCQHGKPIDTKMSHKYRSKPGAKSRKSMLKSSTEGGSECCSTTQPLRSAAQAKEYFSFINPGIDMGMDYSSQISIKSRDHNHLDRELILKLNSPPQMQLVRTDARGVNRSAFKNLAVLGLSFMFVFTAFVSLQSFQSTMNAEAGVGVVSLSCVYAATVFSCLFAPLVIRRLTTKWTIVSAFILFVLYICANFYPKDFLLYPTSILLGLLTGPLWSAQATYVATLAIQYAHTTGTPSETILNRFTSLFMGIYQTSQVWGHIISIAVLDSHKPSSAYANISSSPSASISMEGVPPGYEVVIEADSLSSPNTTVLCGTHACGAMETQVAEKFVEPLSLWVRSTLLTIHLCAAGLGLLLIVVGLDKNHLKTADPSNAPSLPSKRLTMLYASLRISQGPCLFMLLPLVLFTGLEQGFIFGDYTKSYVSCSLGIYAIGSVMICFGATTALSSFVIGYMATHVKRFAIMASGSLFSAGLFLALLYWKPKHDDPPMFYVIAGCMGVCDAIWQTQTATLFGLLFNATPTEAVFACYRMVQALGFAVAFGYSPYLCVHTKLYVLASALLLALVFYAIVEYKIYHTQRVPSGAVTKLCVFK